LAAIIKNIHRVKVLRRALSNSKPDLIISFLIYTNILTVIASLGLGHPVIISERDDPWHPTDNLMWRTLRKMIYPLANKIIVHTPHAKTYFAPWLHPKITPLPNPLIVPDDLKPKENYEPKGIIVSIGRLAHQKGFDTLIQAFKNFLINYPRYQLVIIGEGPEYSRLNSLCKEWGLMNHVIFKGAIKNVFDDLKNADFFVLASRYEGFGNVLCEAMACGVPIISTKTSGALEILQDTIDSLLVPIENPEALTEKMEFLAHDQKKRELLGKNAVQTVKRFRKEIILSKWDELIEK
jgi:glycosyltransferase involved in cell wall biosynthesis